MNRVAWYVDVKNKATQPKLQVSCDFYCVYSDEDDHRLSSCQFRVILTEMRKAPRILELYTVSAKISQLRAIR